MNFASEVRNEAHGLSEHSWKVGVTWGRIIASLNLTDDSILMEIAPGHSPKVGFGLLLAHPKFCGTIYLIEPDAQALDTITLKYQQMFPSAQIVGQVATLAFASGLLPPGTCLDAVLANHPLDDMIIGRDFATGSAEYMEYFTGMYQEGATEEQKLLAEASAWHNLEHKRPHDCAHFKREVLADWIHFLNETRPRHIAISQYKSRTLLQYGLEAPDRLAFDVLKNVARELPLMSRRREKILVKQGFDPKRWIVSTLHHNVNSL